MTDKLSDLEKTALGSLAAGNAFNILLFAMGATLQDATVGGWYSVRALFAIVQFVAFDLTIIATVQAMRDGRRSRWGGATVFAAALAAGLIGIDVSTYRMPFLHAAYAVVLPLFMMHLAQPTNRVDTTVTPPVITVSPLQPKQLLPGQRANMVRRHHLRMNGGFHSRREWLDLCARFGYRCAACGVSTVLTKDHVIPVSQGGKNTIDNIQPLCQSCNTSKLDRTIDYRASALERLTQEGPGNKAAAIQPTRRDKVAALAKEQGVSQRTIWRRVKTGELTL